MTTPFIGEIQLFGFNFAPREWATCTGALLPISQNTALFSLVGTTYGGDGRTTFGLPDYQGRAPCSQGHGPGLTARQFGETFGEAEVPLQSSQIPSHSHSLNIYAQTDASKLSGSPQNGYAVAVPKNTTPFAGNAQADTAFNADSIGTDGGGQPHENRQPYLALNFCIALQGVYPTFS